MWWLCRRRVWFPKQYQGRQVSFKSSLIAVNTKLISIAATTLSPIPHLEELLALRESACYTKPSGRAFTSRPRHCWRCNEPRPTMKKKKTFVGPIRTSRFSVIKDNSHLYILGFLDIDHGHFVIIQSWAFRIVHIIS